MKPVISQLLPVLYLAAAAGASAAINLTTSQNYDSNTNANQVDAVAGSGPISNPAAAEVLAGYAAIFSQAYTAGQGGVITFDNITLTSTDVNDATLSVSYGAGGASTLTITTSTNYGNYQFQSAAVVGTPISGGTYMRVRGGTVSGQIGVQSFNFSQALSHVAFTVLARTDASRNVTGTVTFNDGTTAQLSSTISGSALPTNDTFFGFTAPDGKTITGMKISAGDANYFAIDDLAFVVAIPEPSAALLGFLSLGTLLARRSRRAH